MKILIMALASVFSFFAVNAGNVFYWRSQHVEDHTAIGGALPEFFENMIKMCNVFKAALI